MRATTLLRRLLDLPGIAVRGFSLSEGRLDVDVALTRRRLECSLCDAPPRARSRSPRR